MHNTYYIHNLVEAFVTHLKSNTSYNNNNNRDNYKAKRGHCLLANCAKNKYKFQSAMSTATWRMRNALQGTKKVKKKKTTKIKNFNTRKLHLQGNKFKLYKLYKNKNKKQIKKFFIKFK